MWGAPRAVNSITRIPPTPWRQSQRRMRSQNLCSSRPLTGTASFGKVSVTSWLRSLIDHASSTNRSRAAWLKLAMEPLGLRLCSLDGNRLPALRRVTVLLAWCSNRTPKAGTSFLSCLAVDVRDMSLASRERVCATRTAFADRRRWWGPELVACSGPPMPVHATGKLNRCCHHSRCRSACEWALYRPSALFFVRFWAEAHCDFR